MIKAIKLENYRVYDNKTINFENLEIISGRNGTGKTSLVEAIGFALFGTALQRGKANEWIRTGNNNGNVTLWLDSYIISRGSKQALVTDIDGNVLARNNIGINEWVEKTYGLTIDLYKTSFYIGQKDIGAFAALAPLERTKRVEKLLKIDKLDEIKDKAKELARTAQGMLATYESKLENSFFEEAKLKALLIEKSNKKDLLADTTIEYENLLVAQGEYNQLLALWTSKQKLEKSFDGIVYDLDMMEANYKAELIHNANVSSNNKSLLEKQNIEKKLSNVVILEKYFNSDIIDIMNHEKALKIFIKLKNELESLNVNRMEHDLKALELDYEKARQIYDLNKNIPEFCPTCKQTWPSKPLTGTREKMLAAEARLKIARLEHRAFEIESQLVKPTMTQEEINLAIDAINFKHDYTRFKELKALNLKYQEEYILTNIKYCREQNSISEQLYKLVKVVEPGPIFIAPTKAKLDELTKQLDSINKAIAQQESYKAIEIEFSTLRDSTKERFDTLKEFIKFIDKYRKAFGANIIPLLETNVSTIVAYLTESKYTSIKINNDYSIDNFEFYSGSEQDSINFALRLAIAQVSRIGSFKTVILDEIAASFDSQKEKLLLDILKQQSNQLIYITHGDI